jgi:hypothetical protein
MNNKSEIVGVPDVDTYSVFNLLNLVGVDKCSRTYHVNHNLLTRGFEVLHREI